MSDDYGTELAEAFLDEVKRRLYDDSMPRIEKCLSLLSDEEIWHRPNEETVSLGNLVLHLEGNVHQNVVHAFGGEPNLRDRPKEFSETGPIPAGELLDRLTATMDRAREALDAADPHSLLQQHTLQGYTETRLSILTHTVEHFSYHVGQMTWYVKSTKNVDTGYYAGIDVNQK